MPWQKPHSQPCTVGKSEDSADNITTVCVKGQQMALDAELGKQMLQLITSRYDDRHWRKKIEKTLSLPQTGVRDPIQQQIFMYLKIGLKAYKSRRADPDSWIIGGYATKEVIDRAKFQPQLVGPNVTKDDVACLGSDPGKEINDVWWDEMLVSWFDVPEEEKPAEEEGVKAARAVGADLIVLCSSDDEYVEFAPATKAAIGEGKEILVVAGAPACTDDLKAQGITNFINVRSNVLQTLQDFNKQLGIL